MRHKGKQWHKPSCGQSIATVLRYQAWRKSLRESDISNSICLLQLLQKNTVQSANQALNEYTKSSLLLKILRTMRKVKINLHFNFHLGSGQFVNEDWIHTQFLFSSFFFFPLSSPSQSQEFHAHSGCPFVLLQQSAQLIARSNALSLLSISLTAGVCLLKFLYCQLLPSNLKNF